MAMYEDQKIISAIKKLTPKEQTVFNTAIIVKKKSQSTAFLLCLFLGFLGAHKFYMNRGFTGVIYLIGSITVMLSPVVFIAVLFDLFNINSFVHEYHKSLQKQVLKDIFKARRIGK